MDIRKSTLLDIDQIVDVHRASFPDFFLTRMGSGFLRKYYNIVMEYKGGLVLVAHEEGQVVGFVAGFHQPEEFYGFLAANRMRLVFPALRGLILRPALLPRFLQNKKTVQGNSEGSNSQVCELSSIGVHPDFVGRGAGSLLLNAFLQRAKSGGSVSVKLTTDFENNDSVNNFYIRNGFKLERVFDSGNQRKMNEYGISLNLEGRE